MDIPRITAARLLSRKTAATVSAVLVAGVAAGCSSGGGNGATSNSPIVVCEIAATSGPFVQLGTDDELGAVAWAKLVNSRGGVLGRQVKLVPENDASDPATAAALVRKCVTQDHANFIFGPEETATASAAIPIANQLQTVLLGWQSGWEGQGVTEANLHSYSFPGINNVFYGDDLATVTQIIVPNHYTRVAVIEDNSPGGLGNTQYTESLQSKYGFKVVASQLASPGSTNDTPQVLKLLAANPQLIVLGLIPGPDTITFIKALRAQDPAIPVSECAGCDTSTFVQAAGGPSAMKGVYLGGSAGDLLTAIPVTSGTKAGLDDTKAYIAAMKAAGMTTNQINQGSEGWSTGRELAAAITTAKSVKSSDVKNALAHQTLVTGGIAAYYWQRTPNDYSNITQILSAVVTVQPDGSFKVLPHVGD